MTSPRPRFTRTLVTFGAVAGLAVGLAPAASAGAPAQVARASGQRLVVSTETGALVLNANRLSTIDSIPTAARPGLSPAGDGRHVFLTPSGTGSVLILDTGAKVEGQKAQAPHLEPGRLSGVRPAHVNAEHGRTAVFDDGTGVFQVVADENLSSAMLTTSVYAPFQAHHGVAVPLEKGYLVSAPAEGSATRVGVAHVSDDGTVVQRWDACPGLHGEGHAAGGVVAFGCEDGIFLHQNGQASKINEPVAEGRVSTLAGSEDSPILAGNFTATQILLADTVTKQTQVVDLGTRYRSIGRDDEGRVIVLGDDGAIHVIDPVSGEKKGSVNVTAGWAEDATAMPAMTVSGHEAFVVEPSSHKVVRVNLDTLKVARSVRLPVAPVSVVAPGGGHSH